MSNMDSIVMVNGVKMTLAAYRKQLRAMGKIQPKKRVKKQPTEIQLDSKDIVTLVNGVKLLKSFKAYRDNGYRQWGCKCRDVINMRGIKEPFLQLTCKYWEIRELVNKIEVIGCKCNEKAVFDYMETLGYRLDDMIQILLNLSKAISENQICYRYKNEKFVYENDKRLGLRELMSRVCRSVIDMQNIIITCGAYQKKGIDAFDYTDKCLNGMLSCWSGNER